MYMIYAKFSGEKRFYPLDLKEGVQVKNKIFASIIDEKKEADKVKAHLEEKNPNVSFQVRKVN